MGKQEYAINDNKTDMYKLTKVPPTNIIKNQVKFNLVPIINKTI